MKKPLKCKYCKKLFLAKELETHQKQCRINKLAKNKNRFEFKPEPKLTIERIIGPFPDPTKELKLKGKTLAKEYTLGVIVRRLVASIICPT